LLENWTGLEGGLGLLENLLGLLEAFFGLGVPGVELQGPEDGFGDGGRSGEEGALGLVAVLVGDVADLHGGAVGGGPLELTLDGLRAVFGAAAGALGGTLGLGGNAVVGLEGVLEAAVGVDLVALLDNLGLAREAGLLVLLGLRLVAQLGAGASHDGEEDGDLGNTSEALCYDNPLLNM